MTLLTNRPRLGENEEFSAFSWWIVLVVVGIVGGGLAALITGASNEEQRADQASVRAFVGAIQNPRLPTTGEHAAAIALLRDLAGQKGTLREFATIRHGQNPDPLVLFQEMADAVAKSMPILTSQRDHVRQALAGEGVPEDKGARLWSPGRTFLLVLGLGWVSGSLMFWLVLCWWYGIFEGYHPYSGLGWNAAGVYVATSITLPGVIMNAMLVGIFYIVYGIFIGGAALARTPARTPEEPSSAAPAGTSAPQPSARAEPTPPSLPEPPAAKRDTPETRLPEDVDQLIREHRAAREQNQLRFVTLVQQGYARRGEVVTDSVNKAAAVLEQAQRSFVCARAAYEKWRRFDQNGRAAEAMRELYDRLWTHPRVRALHISEDEQICIHPTTTIIPHRGERYEIGDFALRIEPSTGRYHSICLRQASKRAVHPFEQQTGGICFGGAAGGLQAFVDTLDYAAFVDYALVMMEQPGKDMHYWRTIE